jgi:hypothetical protein
MHMLGRIGSSLSRALYVKHALYYKYIIVS